MARFDLWGIAILDLPSSNVELATALSLDTESSPRSNSATEKLPILHVVLDDGYHALEWRGARVVGGTIWSKNESIVLSDGGRSLCDFVSASDYSIERTIRMHPSFKSGRFYYQILLPFLLSCMRHSDRTFIHASAWESAGRASLLAAWGGTGKTNELLVALQKGDGYLADDLAIVGVGGECFPFTRPLNLFGYNETALPQSGSWWRRRWRAERAAARLVGQLGSMAFPHHRTFVGELEKRLTQRFVRVRTLGLRESLMPVPIASIEVLHGVVDEPPSRTPLASANLDAIEAMLFANLRAEFAPQQRLEEMVAVVSGRPVRDVISERDRIILRRCLESVVAHVVPT